MDVNNRYTREYREQIAERAREARAARRQAPEAYNRRHRLSQVAIYGTLTALTIGIGANIYHDAHLGDGLQPDQRIHLLQAGETIDTLASEVCPAADHTVIVDFILEHSHISETEIGSLPVGKPIVLPEASTC